MTIKTQSYVDNFKNLIDAIEQKKEDNERKNLSIAKILEERKDLEEKKSKYTAEIIELRNNFEDNFVTLYRNRSEKIEHTYFNYGINLTLNFLIKNMIY